jgi:hypothetical protein
MKMSCIYSIVPDVMVAVCGHMSWRRQTFLLVCLVVLNQRLALFGLKEASDNKLRWWFVVISENR